MEFGKLEYLDLRLAWKNEASNFTPWLADNIQVLGDVLGLELELREREASLGIEGCCSTVSLCECDDILDPLGLVRTRLNLQYSLHTSKYFL